MIQRIFSLLLTVILCTVSTVLASGLLVRAEQNGEVTVTVVATIQPQRLIVVDKNLTIVTIVSNTAQDVRPIVLLESLDGKEIPYSESITEQYLAQKPELDFSKPALFDIAAESGQLRNKNYLAILGIGAPLGIGAALGVAFLRLRLRLRKRKLLAVALLMVFSILMPSYVELFAQTANSQVHTTSAGLVERVAPGELLPFSVKLLNFGGGNKIDVVMTYEIINEKEESIYHMQETVAVETTASFVKYLQIPSTAAPGTYTARTLIAYKDQVAPATTQFSFQVERKIFGLFQRDFFLTSGVTTIVGVLMVLLGHSFVKRRRMSRFVPLDYSGIPHNARVFYELLSDTIMEMRGRVGDDALDIASHIDGLKIDEETGRVLEFTEHPSKIIAVLVAEYEKLFGKKVSFSFRRDQKNS